MNIGLCLPYVNIKCGLKNTSQRSLRNEFVTELVGYPVSKQVNSVLNNDPSNIKPYTQMQLEF